MKDFFAKNIPALLVILLFLGLQLSFIKADPHPDVSTSRGPFTDEGLNTHQVRNYVNLGEWGVNEGDNLIKSPLYNGYMAVSMKTFDSSRPSARFTVLITTLLLLLWFGNLIGHPNLTALFVLIGGFQFHIFQFFHFSMVEMLVNGCILIAIGFAYRFLATDRPQFKWLAFCLTTLYVTFLLKIQYAYLFPFIGFVWGIAFFRFKGFRVELLKHLSGIISLSLVFGLLFYFGWYKPNQEIFDTVWAHQGGNRFASIKDWYQTFMNSGQHLIWKNYNQIFSISFLISLPLGLYFMAKAKQKEIFLLVLSLLWLKFEIHKTLILYLPSRYALSLFAAMALWLCIVLYFVMVELRKSEPALPKAFLYGFSTIIFIPLAYGHIRSTRMLINEKTNASHEVIMEYNNVDFKGQTIAGVWATSLVWNPTAKVIPVWKNFLNDDNLLENQKPNLVVTENDELDSEGVFKDRGVDLEILSKSKKSYNYGPYVIHFYELE